MAKSKSVSKDLEKEFGVDLIKDAKKKNAKCLREIEKDAKKDLREIIFDEDEDNYEDYSEDNFYNN